VKLNSQNEWDLLKTVIVGTVEGFRPGLEMQDARSASFDKAYELAKKAFPDWYLDEVAEDLEGLCKILRDAGVTVLRPGWGERTAEFTTPNWSAAGFDIYNVRDLHIVLGNTLVACAPSSRFRQYEALAFQDLLYENFFEEGFKWICAPMPRLKGKYLHEIKRPRTGLENTEEELHGQLSGGLKEVFHYLDNHEIIFDAANIIRVDRDILFLISCTGNLKAVQWLSAVLGPEYTVHVTHAYRSSHLDSTILPIRHGTVMLNGARVNESTCPELFKKWDKIYCTDVAPVPEAELEFHRSTRLPAYNQLSQMGVDSGLNHISSPWAGLNFLSISPDTVLVHDRQTSLIRELERKQFTVIPVRMRHCYTMLGGLHCTTLDVVRASSI
jgi:glycine amidinotransferase/scyllo-inosamine-4-phosphate amidinotransferase 1